LCTSALDHLSCLMPKEQVYIFNLSSCRPHIE
jgi:hypothetical protein